jgi:hypothetical protein
MATVSFGEGGGIRGFLVDITPRGQNINSELYIQTLKTLQKRFNKV